jgi:hypothetical protein
VEPQAGHNSPPSIGCHGHNRRAKPLPISLWNEGNYSFVGTTKYVHSYPSDAKVRVTPLFPTVESSSQDGIRSIDHHSAGEEFTIRAVYYVNTKINAKYDTWIHNQFVLLPPVDELYIVADANSCAQERRLHDAFEWLKRSRNESVLELECHDTNGTELFEYHGIHKIWEVGQKHPGRNDIGIYFHSKGLTHAPDWTQYRKEGRVLDLKMEEVLGETPMDRVQEAFRLFPDLDVAGQECGFSKSIARCCRRSADWGLQPPLG